MKPEATIVIPCYNEEANLDFCLDSIVKSRKKNIEIICVDDGSTDRTPDIIRGRKEIRSVFQSNLGACKARNVGVALASSDLIKFLDADDQLLVEGFEKQIDFANSLPEKNIPFGNFLIENFEKSFVEKTSFVRKSQIYSLISQDILTSTPLHRKKEIERIGGFDETLVRGQEWNLHVRLSANGVKFTHHNDIIYIHNKSSIGNRISDTYKDNFEKKIALNKSIILKTLESVNCTPGYSSVQANRAFAKKMWGLGRACLREGEVDLAKSCFEEALKIEPHSINFLPLYYYFASTFVGANNYEKALFKPPLSALASRVERGLWRRT